jgi:glycosyltransferase involved in cell wall biosynthesis
LLRIGVDARELLGARTGVGRYLGELIRRWARRSDADRRRFILYAPEPLSIELPPDVVDCRIGGHGTGTWWEQTWLGRAVRRDKPDAFFAPAYTAPLGIGVPLAVTIHDLSFFAHPEWFRPREGLRRRWLTRAAARSAEVIFTDSQFSRREIERHLQVDDGRLRVISPGLTRRTVRPRAPLTETAVPLVLYVGSLFNRRRLPDLIASFADATRDLPAARLVIVGDDRTWPRQNLRAVAAACGVGGRTELRNYVSDDELGTLYAHAWVFAFLSEYEGFGLTPLEAMSAGLPAVVLDTPVAREVYGEAAVYVPADDIPATAAALRRFLTSPAAAREVLQRAPDILSRYSWDQAATLTLEHIERIAGR